MPLRPVDDFSGEMLEVDHQPIQLQVESSRWNLYLTNDSKDKLYAALEPFIANADPVERENPYTRVVQEAAKPSETPAPKRRGRAKIDTYGYEFEEVRAWSIANGVKTKSGKPVSDSTRVLNQEIYNQYRDAQTK